ncbi:protein NEN1-like isoform X2 [Lycium barbarum]|uniref:protein NEN1-like isoform X2 n=1 Tax=Lycium barbarum TaxID=112863 RepID=UPI00293F79DC|nr:protein NEN1-like isoform X2 [Lycium barbarum]XP_060196617.1 protein NEN1-like isoform X2 [Lycium barbarum]
MEIMNIDGQHDAIVFFDVETTCPDPFRILYEFGSIYVCPRRLIELNNTSYKTLIRPDDLDILTDRSWKNLSEKGITREDLVSAPHFSKVADTIYHILHDRIWAGHNIEDFDCARIKEAFDGINKPAPEYRHLIDSQHLLTGWFGKRAGNMKLDSLAAYFGSKKQVHRSLDDVRMNLEVVKHCGAVLFLESMCPEILPQTSWISPDEVSIYSTYAIPASFYDGNPKIRIMHHDIDLKLHCSRLKVRFGIRKFDNANRRLTFVVDASSLLCEILDKCDVHAEQLYKDFGGNSEWLPVVHRVYQSIRLRLKARGETHIERHQNGSFTNQRVESSNFDSAELERLIIPGNFVDAYLSLDTFDYMEKAGIRLVADKLIIHH